MANPPTRVIWDYFNYEIQYYTSFGFFDKTGWYITKWEASNEGAAVGDERLLPKTWQIMCNGEYE